MAQKRTSQRKLSKPPQDFEEAVQRMEDLANASENGTLSSPYGSDAELEQLRFPNGTDFHPQPVRFNHRKERVEFYPYDAFVVFGFFAANFIADVMGLRKR